MTDVLIRRGALLLVAFWLLAYVAPLGWRPLVQPDEIRYGEIAREMLTTGDWVVPRLSGLRYFDRPPLGHWMNATSLAAFGENAFAIRFASCLSMGALALCAWLFTRHYSRSRQAATIAALVFLSCPGAMAMGNFAAMDGILSMWQALALMACFHATNAATGASAMRRYALCGALLGSAFLTKGFLAVITPIIVIIPFMAWEQRLRELLRFGWIALATAVAVSLPWSLLIHAREPDFCHDFLSVEHIHSFYNRNAKPGESLSYYLPLLLLITFPWLLLFAGAPLREIMHNRSQRMRRLDRFCICWIGSALAIFLIARSKLPMYVLPCLIPMAVLMGTSAARLIEAGGEGIFQSGIQLSRGVLVLALITAVLNFTAGFGTPAWRAHETVQWIWLCIVLMIWIGLLRIALTASPRKRHWIIALSVVPAFTLLPLYMPELIYAGRMPGNFLKEQADTIAPDAIIATDSTLLSSASWYFKRTDIYLVGSAGEAEYGLSYADARHRHIDYSVFGDFIAQSERPVAYFDKFGGKPPPDDLPRGASEGVMGRFILFRYYPGAERDR